MQVLYDYITHPLRTLERYRMYSVGRASLVALALLAFPAVGHFGPSFLIQELFWMMIIGIGVLVQSMTMDFFAQLLGYTSQSFTLFRWLILSYLPWLILLPLGVVLGRDGLNQSGFLSLLYFIVQVSVLYLQVMTVKTLYRPSNWGLFGIYVFPFLFLVGGFVLFILFGLSLLPSSFPRF